MIALYIVFGLFTGALIAYFRGAVFSGLSRIPVFGRWWCSHAGRAVVFLTPVASVSPLLDWTLQQLIPRVVVRRVCHIAIAIGMIFAWVTFLRQYGLSVPEATVSVRSSLPRPHPAAATRPH